VSRRPMRNLRSEVIGEETYAHLSLMPLRKIGAETRGLMRERRTRTPFAPAASTARDDLMLAGAAPEWTPSTQTSAADRRRGPWCPIARPW
jgi:hypothetical protein